MNILYSVIYDAEVIEEAKRAKDFLLKISLGEVEAYTTIITGDEIIWIVRKLFGPESSVEQGRLLLTFPNLRFLAIKKGMVLRALREV